MMALKKVILDHTMLILNFKLYLIDSILISFDKIECTTEFPQETRQ